MTPYPKNALRFSDFSTLLYTCKLPTLPFSIGTHAPLWTTAIVLKSDTAHPTCFTFRTKVNPQEKYILPYMQYTNYTSSSDRTSTSHSVYKLCNSVWSIVANIGRGSYGHAILMQRTSITTSTANNANNVNSSVGNRGTSTAMDSSSGAERVVYKVDTNRDSVLWEAFIHMQVRLYFVYCF